MVICPGKGVYMPVYLVVVLVVGLGLEAPEGGLHAVVVNVIVAMTGRDFVETGCTLPRTGEVVYGVDTADFECLV